MRATSERKAFPQRGDAGWAIAIPKRAKYHFALQTARSTATCTESIPKRAKYHFALQTARFTATYTESIPKRALRRARSPPGQCRRAIGWSDPALLERIQLNSPFSLTAQEPLAPRLRACAPDLPAVTVGRTLFQDQNGNGVQERSANHYSPYKTTATKRHPMHTAIHSMR